MPPQRSMQGRDRLQQYLLCGEHMCGKISNNACRRCMKGVRDMQVLYEICPKVACTSTDCTPIRVPLAHCTGSQFECNYHSTCRQCAFDECFLLAECLGQLLVQAQCFNLIKDGTETDRDCGGSCAAKCPLGTSCTINADCVSGGFCVNRLCVVCWLSRAYFKFTLHMPKCHVQGLAWKHARGKSSAKACRPIAGKGDESK
jgi:hypothetical protein